MSPSLLLRFCSFQWWGGGTKAQPPGVGALPLKLYWEGKSGLQPFNPSAWKSAQRTASLDSKARRGLALAVVKGVKHSLASLTVPLKATVEKVSTAFWKRALLQPRLGRKAILVEPLLNFPSLRWDGAKLRPKGKPATMEALKPPHLRWGSTPPLRAEPKARPKKA